MWVTSMLQLLERLKTIEQRSSEIGLQMSDPAVISDRPRFQQLAKAHAELEPVVDAFQRHRKLLRSQEETKTLLHDGVEDDVRELAERPPATVVLLESGQRMVVKGCRPATR